MPKVRPWGKENFEGCTFLNEFSRMETSKSAAELKVQNNHTLPYRSLLLHTSRFPYFSIHLYTTDTSDPHDQEMVDRGTIIGAESHDVPGGGGGGGAGL